MRFEKNSSLSQSFFLAPLFSFCTVPFSFSSALDVIDNYHHQQQKL